MDNTTIETDPWADMGNMSPQKTQNGEVSAENLKRAEEWSQAMQNPPAFSGEAQPQPVAPAEAPTGIPTEAPMNTPVEASVEAPVQLPTDGEQRDENIAEAEAILFQGPINAAAKEKGIEPVVQSIKNFVYDGNGDPIKQLLTDASIDTPKEITDMAEESRAIKQAETTFRTENINAPTFTKKSEMGALSAIKEFKELIAEVETSPDYANLRESALRNGKTVWEEAVREYNVRDLTTLFDSLSKQKSTPAEDAPQKPESLETPQPETQSQEPEIITPETITSETITPETLEPTTITPDIQIENQSSTENSTPETDATASTGFMLQ